ncbi:MAG: efflux RND transporter permease subunit [Oceanococcus sp.]
MTALVRWFAHNPIAANLVMIMVFVGGLTTFSQLDKEFFPQRKLNQISVTVTYPGANPREVEKQIVQRIEEAVGDLDGIAEMRSTAAEALGRVVLDVASGEDGARLLDDVRTRVDAINTFPAEADRPNVSEAVWRSRMISLALAGDLPEAELKELGESIREELAALPSVSLVELRSPRTAELSIEVEETNLRQFGLRFEDLAQVVRASSVNLPGGKLLSADGDIQIQARGQANSAQDFSDIVVQESIDGAHLRLGDIARVTDGFEETNVIGRFNGRTSYAIDAYVTTHPDVLQTSKDVHAYVADAQARLPAGVELRVWRDMSIPFRDRLSTLTSNGLGGLALVFILLLLFLRPLLAFWVCCGIAVAFLGAIWLLPVLGTSLNMVSLFAFILILGIVVDDAIIVGEAVYREQSHGYPGLEGAVRGASSVLKPVSFAVISTMLFFAPFYFLPEEAAEPPSLADVVMLALAFSLFESLFILPTHLAHMKPESPGKTPILSRLESWRERFAHGMEHFIARYYRPFLQGCIRYKGLTVASFAMAFVLVISVLVGGWIAAGFFPKVPGNYIVANVKMAEGTPFTEVSSTLDRVVSAAEELKQELNVADADAYAGSIESVAHNTTIRVTLELLNAEKRKRGIDAIRDQWQAAIGDVSNARDIDFVYTIVPSGKPIELQLKAADVGQLRETADALSEALERYPGVFNVRHSLESPLTDIEIHLKPHAGTLGIGLIDVARQVRRGFYGEEIQRIPRLREDVRVMLRYPRSERESIHSIREMMIRTADGGEVPFESVAELVFVDGYSSISRIDRKRVASVTADLQVGYSAGPVIKALLADKGAELQQAFPDVSIQKEGEQQRQSEFLDRVVQLMMLSLILIYGLMAVVFRSYWQPMLILTAVPFGFMGGLLGHIIMGQELAMFSMLGMIACAGVVVNDNLVLIDRINQLRAQGKDAYDAVVNGAGERFRPIILTSLTTFIGLTPIMLETSTQAQFLLPMVVALAFGVLTATFVTLLFVPCVYLLGEAVSSRFAELRSSPVSDELLSDEV